MDMSRATQITHVLLRVVAGMLLFQHGGQKLFGWLGGVDGSGAKVALMSQMGLAGGLEFFGGIAIVLGLYVRPVAFVLSGLLAVAYFQVHQSRGAWPIQNHGEVAVLYSFIFLSLAARGAGRWSFDAIRRGGLAAVPKSMTSGRPVVARSAESRRLGA